MGRGKNMKEYSILSHLVSRMQDRSLLSNQHNLAAVVVDKKGSPISFGFNSYEKTHPMQKFYNIGIKKEAIYLHAEISALVKCASTSSVAYGLIIARLSKEGKLRLAKPCKGCYKAILDSKIPKVFYTNNYGELVLLDTSIPFEGY